MFSVKPFHSRLFSCAAHLSVNLEYPMMGYGASGNGTNYNAVRRIK